MFHFQFPLWDTFQDLNLTILKELAFNSLYGIPWSGNAVPGAGGGFQFPLWDTKTSWRKPKSSGPRHFQFPLWYTTEGTNDATENNNNFQFPLWDTLY